MTEPVDRGLNPESVKLLEQAQSDLADVLGAITKLGQMPWNHGGNIVKHHADLLTSIATAIGNAKLTLAASRDLSAEQNR